MSFFSIFLKKKESVPVKGPKGISILGHTRHVESRTKTTGCSFRYWMWRSSRRSSFYQVSG
ncbi:hypothetical protein A7Q10_00585 [Methylacidiphilum caldifontis]|uniref:Uncharacterized protein n=1 Tax=Methylacidiphilum caldifontis TaxID=2795386 RepID=A0A4Y8PBL9_9BACT|nr:hypothetical protein A7Q10_00585 [Methylacidiphilum caldifontis]